MDGYRLAHSMVLASPANIVASQLRKGSPEACGFCVAGQATSVTT